PTGVGRTVEHEAVERERALVLVAGNRGAALHVPEDVVPGVADLAGEQAQRVNLRAVGDGAGRQEEQAGVGAGEVRPVALGFKTEHPVAGLPAIADLTADGRAARGVGAFTESGKGSAAIVVDVPALVGPAAAAVHA